tara:strand:- start:404 stop:835 length:432 start_codon:yes stop_codon:yes gene_type:complete
MTIPITFNLDSSDYTAQLGFDVLLNNNLVFTTEHVTELTTVAVDIDDIDAEHELKFVLKNKTQAHTQVDQQGNILNDAMLSISNIAFDEVRLTHVFFEQTVYNHDMNGSQALTKHKFFGNMGCNGYVSLKFTTPFYIWLLENM